ncbi:PP0621 family protein [Ectothiorhodospira lacustris]|uniref:PP0621 family protein n=1 Tax=Ectothiorhodospira lacustris TaxID=2899127 RepID=UPI001EE7EE69|nr:PP0621 family protein [Ectothiorhodospira lacustris]MCG5501007.1 hypothetical protein [Ectothiorhodospira lacustris]MCG5510559.1 hypothetical protein [Ectothiorhodospira lacustris]MCG5521251.1 hypothetical protein [Ectothiorhodospira lacustris]
MQILFLIASIVLVFMVVRLMLKTPDVPRPEHPGKLSQKTTGKMLRCHYCGLHIPEEESLWEGGKPFCSESHRDLALSQESTRE